MILASINWNVNPEIFRVGWFSIRYYGVAWALAFYVGYIVFNQFVKREKLPEGFLDSLTIYTVIGTVVGARLGHCLFYQPSYYLGHPIEILKIWEGGLASHGAALGILIAIWMFSRKHKKPYLYVFDRLVIPVALGGAFVRLGNLMNSEIYGVETTLPWGFVFEREHEIFPKHPTQIYEALCYLLIFLILYFIYIRSNGKPRQGFIFGVFLILLFGARFMIEFVKEPQVNFEKAMTYDMGQLLSIPFILAGVALAGYSLYRNRDSQGREGLLRPDEPGLARTGGIASPR